MICTFLDEWLWAAYLVLLNLLVLLHLCLALGAGAGWRARLLAWLEARGGWWLLASGFAGARLRGSEHNDLFENRAGRVRTVTNRSGGTQGGISNGEEIVFRVAFKPTATILQPQKTVDVHGAETELIGRGRHDPCVVPRAVPIVEAMTALVLVDHWMRQQAQCGTFRF